MKNTILIDVDTDREETITFGKSPNFVLPQTREEGAKMILDDIACLAEAVTTLILIAARNGYADKAELVNATVKTVYQALNESNKTDEVTKKENEPETKA